MEVGHIADMSAANHALGRFQLVTLKVLACWDGWDGWPTIWPSNAVQDASDDVLQVRPTCL